MQNNLKKKVFLRFRITIFIQRTLFQFKSLIVSLCSTHQLLHIISRSSPERLVIWKLETETTNHCLSMYGDVIYDAQQQQQKRLVTK